MRTWRVGLLRFVRPFPHLLPDDPQTEGAQAGLYCSRSLPETEYRALPGETAMRDGGSDTPARLRP